MIAGAEDQGTESAMERRTRALLLESAEALPGEIRSRLTRARQAALGARDRRLRYRLQRWAPTGAVVAAALALAVVYLPHFHGVAGNSLNGSIEDIDLLTSDLPLNADQDVDYQFYEWAVDAAANPSGSPADSAGAAVNGT